MPATQATPTTNKKAPTPHEITNVRKGKPGTHLQHITEILAGGTPWKVADVVKAIDDKTDSFYVMNGKKRVEVETAHPKTKLPRLKPYICTQRDGTTSDNLLNLPTF
jgi:hypothetical protein